MKLECCWFPVDANFLCPSCFAQEDMEVPKTLIFVVSEICFCSIPSTKYIQVRDQFRSWCSIKSFKNYQLCDNQKTGSNFSNSQCELTNSNQFFLGRAVVGSGKNGKSCSIPISDPCSNEIFVF